MSYQLDQSGKIEVTQKKSVISYSNSDYGTVILNPKDKRLIQKYLRSIGLSGLFVYQIFSICIFKLIYNFKLRGTILVDTEYPGKSNLIRDYVVRLLSYVNWDEKVNLMFGFIGKKSRAHKIAIKYYRMYRSPFSIRVYNIKISDIADELVKINPKNKRPDILQAFKS